MLKYLLIPLSMDAVSFCQYDRGNGKNEIIDSETLRKAITFGMKGNLNIHFLYPDYYIPHELKEIINSIDHVSIVCQGCIDRQVVDGADIIVFDSWGSADLSALDRDRNIVIRTSGHDMFENKELLKKILQLVNRLVVVITDTDSFSNKDFQQYSEMLDSVLPTVVEEYKKNHTVGFNLMTDRIFLDKMNNCNAGYESITLAPDGKFYICPAFYIDGSESIGDLENGLDIKNPQLFRLDHAPICRICDAFQCKRCVWQNRKSTLEVNTPSHEQCVISHIERNASRKFMKEIKNFNKGIRGREIAEIDYMDPFYKLTNKIEQL